MLQFYRNSTRWAAQIKRNTKSMKYVHFQFHIYFFSRYINIWKTSMIKSLCHNPTTHACNMPLLNPRPIRYKREASPRPILHTRETSPIICLNILVSTLGCFNYENNLSYLSAYNSVPERPRSILAGVKRTAYITLNRPRLPRSVSSFPNHKWAGSYLIRGYKPLILERFH